MSVIRRGASTLLTGDSEGSILVWVLNTLECKRTLSGHSGAVQSITITPDGTLVAVLHPLEAVRLLGWDAIPDRVVDRDPLHQGLITIDEARHGGKRPTGARVFLPAPHGRRAGKKQTPYRLAMKTGRFGIGRSKGVET